MLVAACCAVMVGLVGVARAAGSATAATFSAYFADPRGKLCAPGCLFGIVPGQTTFDEAVELLKTHPVTRKAALLALDNGLGVGFADRQMLVVLRGAADKPVYDVFVYFVRNPPDLPEAVSPPPRLGDAYLLLRTPTGVAVGKDPMRPRDRTRDFITWYYSPTPLMIVTRLTDQRMTGTTLIKHIQVSAPGNYLGEFNPASFSTRFQIVYSTTYWFGFTHDSRYVTAAMRQRGVAQRLN